MSWEVARTYTVLTNANLVHGQRGVGKSDLDPPVANAIGSGAQWANKGE